MSFDTSQFDNVVFDLLSRPNDISQINIASMPTDYTAMWGSMAAAFFGALAAYVLSARHESAKERQQRKQKIIQSLNSFSIALRVLIGLKSDLYGKLEEEIIELEEYAKRYTNAYSEGHREKFNQVVLPIFEKLNAQDAPYVFMNWEMPRFPALTAAQDLAFFSESCPHSVRIFTLADTKLQELVQYIGNRNACRARNVPIMEAHGIIADINVMRAVYEVLNYRRHVRKMLDEALVSVHESMKYINTYNLQHYPPPNWWKKVLTRMGLRKRRPNIRISPAKEWEHLIPASEDYIYMLGHVVKVA